MSHLLIVVPFVLVCLGVVVLCMAMRRQHRTEICDSPRIPKTTDALLAEAADKAVGRARSRYNLTLDYSIETIHAVDKILAIIHAGYTSMPQLVDLNSLSFVFGAYVGETVRRHHPEFAWMHSHKESGEDVYALQRGETMVFPIEWCELCLKDGITSDLWSRVQNLLRNNEAAETKVIAKARAAVGGA